MFDAPIFDGEEVPPCDREADGKGDAHREDEGERPKGVPQGAFLNRSGNAIGRSGNLLHAIAAAVRRYPGDTILKGNFAISYLRLDPRL